MKIPLLFASFCIAACGGAQSVPSHASVPIPPGVGKTAPSVSPNPASSDGIAEAIALLKEIRDKQKNSTDETVRRDFEVSEYNTCTEQCDTYATDMRDRITTSHGARGPYDDEKIPPGVLRAMDQAIGKCFRECEKIRPKHLVNSGC